MLVDSHCHLNFEQFTPDFEQVIARAKASGIIALQTICTEIEKFEEIYKLTSYDPFIFCSIGTHPLHLKSTRFYKAEEIIEFCHQPKVIGIGETGLDYHYDRDSKDIQIKSFIEHIKAAQESSLPLIIHSREADDDMIKILREYKDKKDFKAVLHCFSSSRELALASIDLGLYISASGIVTFNKAHDLQTIFSQLPLNRILIETDAPYLAPAPNRGKRNEPGFVKHTAEFLANLRGEPFEDFCNATTKNFFELFNKAKLS
jgi:TatD DNase family protein